MKSAGRITVQGMTALIVLARAGHAQHRPGDEGFPRVVLARAMRPISSV
jgi:hypothetical protein